MVDRERKYIKMFKPDLEQYDDQTNDEDSDNTRTAKKIKKANQALENYDSDEERENANCMFLQDIESIRKYFIDIITNYVKAQEDMQEHWNKERTFFLDSTQQGRDSEEQLRSRIVQLKQELEDERKYSVKVWAEEQVSLICQKALFTYKYI